jgi:carboxypeptidase C (cathepsin A)
MRPSMRCAAAALTVLAFLDAAPLPAQEAPARKGQGAPVRFERGADEQRPARPVRSLPPDQTTQHTLELPGRTLKFAATAGSIPLSNGDGRLLAEMAYIAYTLADGEPRARPVTFAFNGGPGAASAWLHLGVLGPWRLPLEPAAAAPSAPSALAPNAETWLDFTDLVMIDPIGTGYSLIARPPEGGPEGGERWNRASGVRSGAASREEGGARYFWSVGGDVESISDFIRIWLQKHGRTGSPKFLVGESYGGFRGPKIAHLLQTRHGVGLSGLVLVSPVLDFTARRGGYVPMAPVVLLPSLAAAASERKGLVPTRAANREAEVYARGEYLADLMRGPRDAAALDRMVTRVAALTGLPEPVVRRLGGRVDAGTYNRELNRPRGQTASAYDASVTGFDPDPTAPVSRASDPFTSALAAPLTSAMVELYATRLGWQPEGRYRISNMDAHGAWIWGNSPSSPEAVSDLKSALALDPRLKVLVAHGFTDLVTPYLASELILDQLPVYGDLGRVASAVYPGGHMFYSREVSRKAFRADALRLYGDPGKRAVN